MMQPRTQALDELEAELSEFSYDGLTLLRCHLHDGRVLRGSWAGCVISYKLGAAGSTRRDRRGRPRNAFTAVWDGGWITDEEVIRLVENELARRRPAPAPALPRHHEPGAPPPTHVARSLSSV
jgi:hypothetical protein